MTSIELIPKNFPIRFNLAIEILLFSRLAEQPVPSRHIVSISQSRYFSFQGKCSRTEKRVWRPSHCFNLAIEILLFSRENTAVPGMRYTVQVSISQSRYFSFQGKSIEADLSRFDSAFQSRNRDTSLFKCRRFVGHQHRPVFVSISQSRYFSFQVSSVSGAGFSFAVSISQSRYFSFQG